MKNTTDSRTVVINYTMTKDFGEFPFGHRQPKHLGHCAFIHGHNWRFSLTLGCNRLDEQGFIFDFGQFGELKEWLKDMFDHTLLIQSDDPQRDFLVRTLTPDPSDGERLADIRLVPSCSCEGVAALFYRAAEGFVTNYDRDNRGLRVLSVTVFEDNKNSASYSEYDV